MSDSNISTDQDLLFWDTPIVAKKLSCSTRHIARLVEAGIIPQPVRLGHLVRWPKQVIEDWIEQGCPATNQTEDAKKV